MAVELTKEKVESEDISEEDLCSGMK